MRRSVALMHPYTHREGPTVSEPLPVGRQRGCGCSRHDDEGVPEIDARLLPHAVRHAAVLGAFEAIADGGSLDLVTPHRPTPLLRQLAERTPGPVTVTELVRDADVWRGRITKG